MRAAASSPLPNSPGPIESTEPGKQTMGRGIRDHTIADPTGPIQRCLPVPIGKKKPFQSIVRDWAIIRPLMVLASRMRPARIISSASP